MSGPKIRTITIVIRLVLWSPWLLQEVMAGLGAGFIPQRVFLQGRTKLNFDSCHDYTGDPNTCREKNCHYNCANALCSSQASSCGMASGCAENCFDVCGCRKLGCHFNFGNSQCRNYTDITCRYNQFMPDECGRKDTHYSFGGEICHNRQQRGNCRLGQVALAVNLQGSDHLDRYGITYQADDDVVRLDPHKLISNATVEEFQGRPSSDRPLYASVLTANSNAHQPGQCVSYVVPICQDGSYELSVKLIDDVSIEPQKRHFNVKIANQYVFPEIDIFTLAGQKSKAIELNINFHVYQSILTLRGFGPEAMPVGGNIAVEFCTSECPFSAAKTFYAAAFSVIRFTSKNGIENSGIVYC